MKKSIAVVFVFILVFSVLAVFAEQKEVQVCCKMTSPEEGYFFVSLEKCQAFGTKIDPILCEEAQEEREKKVSGHEDKKDNFFGVIKKFFSKESKLKEKKAKILSEKGSPSVDSYRGSSCCNFSYRYALFEQWGELDYDEVDMDNCPEASIEGLRCYDVDEELYYRGGFSGCESSWGANPTIEEVDMSYCGEEVVEDSPVDESPAEEETIDEEIPSESCCENLRLECFRVSFLDADRDPVYTGDAACATRGASCVITMYYEYLSGFKSLSESGSSLDVVSQISTCNEDVSSWWDGSYSPTPLLPNGNHAAPYAHCCRISVGSF